MRELSNEKIMLEAQFQQTEKTLNKGILTLEPTKEIFLTASRAKTEFLNAKNEQKHKVLENILWNLEIKDQEMAVVNYKMPYATIKKTPINGDFSQMLGR